MSAPVAASISETRTAIAKAKTKATELKPSVSPAGLPIWEELTKDLEAANLRAAQAEASLVLYVAEVDLLTKDLNAAVSQKNEALRSAEYWQAKQAKALRELWFWRGLATVVVGSVLAYFGLRFAGRVI